MKKGMSIFVVLMAASFSLTVGTSAAEKAYVTDSFQITFRAGPDNSYRIVQMLNSGQELEALRSEDGWTLARLTRRSGETIEGWLLDRYLIRREPWETQTARLRTENEALSRKLASVEADWMQLRQETEGRRTELSSTHERLETLQQEYDRLRQGAAEYLELRREHLEMKAGFEENLEKLQRLTEENQALRSMERTKWFATGGGVLLCGLVIGLIFGRRERKRRSSYY